MGLNLRHAILDNVSGSDASQIEATIVDAIDSGEEKCSRDWVFYSKYTGMKSTMMKNVGLSIKLHKASANKIKRLRLILEVKSQMVYIGEKNRFLYLNFFRLKLEHILTLKKAGKVKAKMGENIPAASSRGDSMFMKM